ncbi:MAG: DNA-directed RNA polymerase subunit beta' [Candidatus Portnoybacteria bacterium RBG_19FT_COMBO_36_7]|uniref:DNA-directed RNA polymerase subunit beta' n=1 Tax=Candidatus Portnoybacteria bacterium RBG_19FT_COMBO_36_7 TaxID=1801992 RepID=A0A1G2F9Q9_9BACT|nr:MAG: DNA-directed RNA polymerase subunit beta' [Candidatus Portnoybacteria bacterium RBG_19FT_COMBO_36_7]HXK32053.1 DNA-directed RNA polymerase subunit beta' [Candidatus Paceibacterota bacterium]
MRVQDLESIRIKLASPDDILTWSRGEVTKPETINYRTQRAEKDGLFCEKIFGPVKDYECYCGKYKGIRYKAMVCDRCGVEVTKAQTRRERMGHISLASPCSHIWFLRGVPSRMGMIFDIPMQQIEKVIYFSSYIVISIDEEAKKKVLEEIEKEYKSKLKEQKPSKTVKKTKGPKKEKIKLSDLKSAKDAAREEVLNLKPFKTLSEIDYHRLSLKYGEIFEASTGAEVLRKIFEKIDLKKKITELKKTIESAQPVSKRKMLVRLKLLQGMVKANMRPEWMFLTCLPVLPPDLRPMVQLDGGRYASSDLNDLYRRVINRNNRLKYLLEIGSPEVIVRNEKRMLQEAVDALIDNSMRKGTMTTATTGGKRLLKSLADILKGKQGRFRQNLLGKRVDYSGRSVIVVGPELKLNQVGIPKKMALELFKPFIIKKLLDKELTYNVRSAARLIEQETDEVWASLEEVVKDKLVLLNRAPTLHRLGIQAFYPILIEGESLRIHPMVCKSFNADFDGDQMAVHLPLSDKAQKEAKEIMLFTHNLLKPATGTPVISINQDIILGCSWMTRLKEGAKGEGKIFCSKDEAILAFELGDIDIQAKMKVRFSQTSSLIETSVGRIIFNEALPENYPFQNSLIKIKDLETITRDIIEKYDSEKTEEALDKIKELGFEYSTWSGVSWGMDDLVVPPEKGKIVAEAEKEIEGIEAHFKKGLLSKEEKSSKVIEVWSRVKTKIEELVPKALPKDGSVFQIIDSGAKGSWGQPVQMAGMKGLVINPAGQIIELPVKSSFKEGFDVLEYFISTHGARKGTADTALRTSTAGYLTRRLVDVAHEAIITEEDCGDKEGVTVLKKDADEIGQNFVFKLLGRICLENVKKICKQGDVIDWEKAEKIAKAGVEGVKIRSPLSCKSIRGVCQKCYGWDVGKNKPIQLGEAVGVVAAQSIGEPGTQLTMRTFHTGGVAGGGDITMGLPRVQEVFEARVPGGKAEISRTDGKVLEITQDKVIKIKSKAESGKSKSKKSEVLEYQIPAKSAIWVEIGQEIKKGQQLCEGSLELKELFKLAGEEEAQKYIIKEIQKIYVSQGALIHDKHIEIICRQMFSRIKIKESEDSSFSPGEIIEKTKFLEENNQLKKAKKKPAKGTSVLLGISRVALTTDSFLSAASFQETSRVLIKASLEGKEDRLRGLKENVIIGKLIPAGTGFKKK